LITGLEHRPKVLRSEGPMIVFGAFGTLGLSDFRTWALVWHPKCMDVLEGNRASRRLPAHDPGRCTDPLYRRRCRAGVALHAWRDAVGRLRSPARPARARGAPRRRAGPRPFPLALLLRA